MDTLTLTAGDASVSVTLPPAANGLIDPDDAESRKRQDTNFKFEVVSPDGTHFSTEALAKKSRSDTNFKFELGGAPAGPDSEPDVASSLTTHDVDERTDDSISQGETFAVADKKRQDTSFSFEITTWDDPADDSAGAFAKKTRTDTSFKFEVVTPDGATGSTELLAGRSRKDTSFKFEVVASDPTEALEVSKRKSTAFDFDRTATLTDGGLTMSEIHERFGDSDLPDETPAEAGRKRQNTSFSFTVTAPAGGVVSLQMSASSVESE